MNRTHPFSEDEQRVADWLLSRTDNQLGAGDDPVGFLIASYELLHAELKEKQQLWTLCEQFVTDQRITCAETVYQTDRVIENAYEFIEQVCDVVGYVNVEDDED